MSYPYRAIRHKPKPKKVRTKPKQIHKNQWYFEKRDNICAEIYKMGMAYLKKFDSRATTPKRHMAYPAQLVKYMFFIYLSGSRSREPLLSKDSRLELRSQNNSHYIYIKRRNEKHFDSSHNPVDLEVAIPIFCESERLMWKFITNGGKDMNMKYIFQFDDWARKYDKKGKQRHEYLTLYMANFRVDLRDTEGVLHSNCPITPHILRHARAFNLLINHRAPEPLILGIMGWTSNQMLYYYAYLRNTLHIENLLKLAIEGGFFKTEYRVDREGPVPLVYPSESPALPLS
jgi:integrase